MRNDVKGALVIWHDIAPGREALVTEWYNREHQLERVRIPGFFWARRYMAIEGSPQLFNLYGVTGPSVLGSPAYRDCVNRPSPTSREAIPCCLRMIRSVAHYRFHAGEGEGGFAGTWRLAAQDGREDELAAWLREEALPKVTPRPGIVSASLLQADAEISALGSRERTLRPDQQEPASLIVVVTATDPAPMRHVSREVLSDAVLHEHGAEAGTPFGLYRLAYAVER